MMVPAQAVWRTKLACRHDGPPPWPSGNHFSLSFDPKDPFGPELWVTNMRVENFDEIVSRLRLETVKVRLTRSGWCEIIDPSIPPEWLIWKR